MKTLSLSPMHFALCGSLLLSGLAMPPASCAEDHAGEGVLKIEELVRIWKEAGEKVKSLRVQFRLQTAYGGMNKSKDKTVDLTGTLWIDGGRWRAETSGLLWHDPAEQFVDTKYIQLFDGTDYLSVFERDERTDKIFPYASIDASSDLDVNTSAAEPTSLPWLLNFRNHDPIFSIIKAAEWRSTSEWAVIDGRPCFAVVRRKPREPYDFRFWICPDLDYRVVRRDFEPPKSLLDPQSDSGDWVVYDDIEYRHDPEYGWIPAAWSETIHTKAQSDGTIRLDEDRHYTVVDLRINEAFPEDPFDYKLPEGTWVRDNTQSKATAKYLVREGGEKRPITQQELSRINGYTELLETESGQAGLPEHPHRVNWLLWGSILVLGVALGRKLLERRI